ncbi:MAG: hypothetical protein LIO46_00135 [Clostridiales bacterium]|nr:hypothetical protein [Clostridiales bacterium]
MASYETIYTNQIFMNAALPLLKTIAGDVPSLKAKFEGVNAIFQVSAMANVEDHHATHFIVETGEWTVKLGEYLGHEKIDAELRFSSLEKMNAFFKGSMSQLPRMKIGNLGKFTKFMQVLLKMSSLLNIEEIPEDEETQRLLVKLYFYLLSSGISQLTKARPPEVHEWASKSPDRVYAWAVEGYPELSAYLRVKAGKTRAGRGEYKRAKPFFCLKFDSLPSALGILMQIDDMLESTKKGKLIMEGAPEFGAQIGAYMMAIAAYAK